MALNNELCYHFFFSHFVVNQGSTSVAQLSLLFDKCLLYFLCIFAGGPANLPTKESWELKEKR